jgi:putative flippase GtrA
MAPLAAFLGSSLLAATLDALLLWLLLATTGWLQGSIVTARLVSATANFVVNRSWVFGRRGRSPLRVELARYTALAAAVLAANVALMTLLDALGVGLVVAKAATEIALWIAGFAVQRAWVFAHDRPVPRPAPKPFVLT